MKKEFINVDSGSIEAFFYDHEDMKKVLKLYKEWLIINKTSKELKGRKINTPEALSEIAVSMHYGYGRTNNAMTKGEIDGKSMDAVTRDGKKIQIKASSVEGGTLTSFSPKTNYDELVVADFYADGEWDGKVRLLRINPFSPEIMVNSRSTFADFQKAGKRPRFNLMAKIDSGEIKAIEIVEININDFLKE